jgi:uncharacterized protein
MLIEFSVSNFRSIKDLQTLSFVATALNGHEDTHVFQANEKTRLLKSVGVYGANSSGKSNLVKAIGAMLGFIKAPFDEKQKFQEQIQPFKFNTATRNEGTFFQIMFILDNKTFRYGFVYDKGLIKSEWLFGTAEKNEVKYFTRARDDFYINKERFEEGHGLIKKTREDNLFLNVVNEFNGEISSSIINYLDDILVIKGVDRFVEDNMLRDLSIEFIRDDDEVKEKLLKLMQVADEDLKDIILRDDDDVKKSMSDKFGKEFMAKIENANSGNEAISEVINNIDISSIMESAFVGGDFFGDLTQSFSPVLSKRDIFNEYGDKVDTKYFNFDEDTSEGTKKLFSYAGAILECIYNGSVIIIDEFGSTLHTLLTKAIINMFNSKENKSAQLCFVVHDTNLLDTDLLGRDQIYFVEKNSKAETSIYSLAEIKAVRNDASFEKDYIKGKYGAIPYVKPLNSIFE